MKKYVIIPFMWNDPLRKIHQKEIALLKFKYYNNNNLGCVTIEHVDPLESKGDKIIKYGNDGFRYNKQFSGIKYPYSLTEKYFNENSFEDYDTAKLAYECTEV